jgi:hypothetical protein
MEIHLICFAVNEFNKDQSSSIHIYSECLGVLKKVKKIPPYPMPTQCSHSYIRKNIMVNCSNLLFTHLFSHIKAQQDNNLKHRDLSQPAQLNC